MQTDSMETNEHKKGLIGMFDFERPRSLVDQIYKTLGRAIARGELAPGQVLKEVELQKAFHVSRAPIREAIRLLEADDLVVVDAFKKKYVRKVTRPYLEDLVPVIACLEGYGASLAATRLTHEQIDLLEEINGEMRSAYDRERYDLCAELNFGFHRIYIKAANNQVLNTAIRSLKKKIIWFWLTNVTYKNYEVIPLSIEEHDLIIKEFRKHDSQNSESAVRSHIVNLLERSIKNASFDSEGVSLFNKTG